MTERIKLPHSPRNGETFELEVTDLSAEGDGTVAYPALVGPQEEPKDFVFHIRKAVPGDEVRVSVETRRKNRVIAHIDELLDASGMRIEPRCKHFGRRELRGEGCGGCTMQMLDYRHQLATKERTVKRLMSDAGIDPGLVHPVVGMDDPWHYRNKMEFSFGDTADREFALGLYPRGYRYEVLNLDECHLESSFTSDFVPAIRRWALQHGLAPYINKDNDGFLRTLTVREGKRTGERLVELMTTHAAEAFFDGEMVAAEEVADAFCDAVSQIAADLDGEVTSVYWTQKRAVRGEPTRHIEHHLAGEESLTEQLHLPDEQQLSFEIHPRAFFQTNTIQAETLYEMVLDATSLKSDAATSSVLDLYCGTGTIALCMAPYAESVAGIELQPDAVDNARRNGQTNGIDNVDFFVGDVGDVLESEEFRNQVGDVETVVVDPPRSGLLPPAREQLEELAPPRIVYVSCNPEALARDLAELGEAGWEIDSIRPVDMFPHTYHIENVVLLEA